MRRARLPLLILLSTVLTPGLAACGGGDSGSSDDENQITDAIQTSVTTTDPADCTKLQTQQFAEQTNFTTGADAITQCEQDAADASNDPESVEVSDVSVDGDTATANVAIIGSAFNGSTLTVSLLKDGDQWKLDKVTDVPTLNLEAFRRSFADQIGAEGGIPPQVSDCITQAFNQATEEDVKQAILDGTQDSLVALFSQCIPSG